MDWRLKALAFHALDVPGGAAVHHFLQRYVTRTWPRPSARLDSTIAIAQRAIELYTKHAGTTPASVIEIGAGRDLAVPLALRKQGVAEVTSIDLDRLASLDLIAHAARHILGSDDIAKSWNEIEQFGIHYRAPCSTVPDAIADCTCSNEVLEHVPVDQLPSLLQGLRKATRYLTIHSIDYSDHYARSDSNLSRFNFLRYSDAQWSRYNSRFQFVNRLRHSDYLSLFLEAGFTIVEASTTPGIVPGALDIDARFAPYTCDDLFTLNGVIVAKPN
jgi:hypothetical protein